MKGQLSPMDLREVGRWRVPKKMIDIYDDDNDEDDEENDDDVAHASRVAKKREKAQSPTSAHLQPGASP